MLFKCLDSFKTITDGKIGKIYLIQITNKLLSIPVPIDFSVVLLHGLWRSLAVNILYCLNSIRCWTFTWVEGPGASEGIKQLL